MDRREFLSTLAVSASWAGLTPAFGSLETPQKTAAGTGICIAPDSAAAEIGATILTQGGNAFDALIASAFAETVISPAGCGIGGYAATGVAYSVRENRVIGLDANAVAPAAATADMFPVISGRESLEYRFPDDRHRLGALSVAVPGVLAGLLHWQEKFGRLSRATVMAPAIGLARAGISLNTEQARTWLEMRAKSLGQPSTAVVDIPGIVPMDELADSLDAIAELGAVVFYRGKIGKAIAEHLRQQGGILTEDDLASYEPVEVEPVFVDVLGHRVFTPPPSSGGLSSLQMLSLFQRIAETESILDPSGVDAAELNIEISKVVWSERLTMLGDPRSMTVSPQSLLEDQHLLKLEDQVQRGRRQPDRGKIIAQDPLRGTAHLIAADQEGNVVSWTQTHGGGFGSKVMVPQTGIVLGHGMCRFEPRPGWVNSIAPGKRPLHNMCPLVAVRDGKPVLAVGAAGGRTIVNNAGALAVQRLVYGKSASEAVAAPRLQCESAEPVTAESTVGDTVADVLRARGHHVNLVSRDAGTAHMLVREMDLWRGAAEPRSERAATAVGSQ